MGLLAGLGAKAVGIHLWMDGYGHSGIAGIGGVSYVALTLPLLLFFFAKKFLVGQMMRRGHEKTALPIGQCRYVLRGGSAGKVFGR